MEPQRVNHRTPYSTPYILNKKVKRVLDDNHGVYNWTRIANHRDTNEGYVIMTLSDFIALVGTGPPVPARKGL
jgi:hypothetical protein